MLFTLALLPVLALASPVKRGSIADEPATDELLQAFEPDTSAWIAGASGAYGLWGNSCNTTQKELIAEGLQQTIKLADHARAHIRRFGNDSQ